MAHDMAIESPKVTADVIQVLDFPELAGLYHVMVVPKTVINDSVQFTGAVSEEVLLQRVLQAVGAEDVDADRLEEVMGQTTPIG